VKVLDRGLDPFALVEQRLAKAIRVDRHPGSFPEASASKRSASAVSMSSATTLSRDV
jgi:hypothetical protein